MKKLFAIIILNVLACGVFAQQNFRLGLTATPTIGWVKQNDGNDLYGSGSGIGFTYGLVGDFNFTDNYAFSTAAQFTSVNGNVTQKLSDGTKADIKYRMSYFEVPLAIKLSAGKVGDLNWYGKFGLSNGFRTGAKRDVTINNSTKTEGISGITSFYRAGLIIGGGAEYSINERMNVFVGLTYNNAFTNFLNEGNIKAKNHFMAINLGLFF